MLARTGTSACWSANPSRQHFLTMMPNAAYREALVHRYAGLERTILLQMQG